MKKYIATFLLSTGLLAGCQDFLDEKMVTSLTQEYYNTVDGMEMLTNGCYQILRYKYDYNQGNFLFGANNDVEVFAWSLADRITMGSYAPEAWNYNIATGTLITPMVPSLIGSISNEIAEGCYPIINRCNIFLSNYATMSADEQEKLSIRRGEVLFLRSYCYYILSNQLGACPIVTERSSSMPDNFHYPKAPLEELYNMLIEDVKDAFDNHLPETTDQLGRITKPAAGHFLAKLHLNRAQAADFENHSEPTLKALYKGRDANDLTNSIQYASYVIGVKGNGSYGGLAEDFGELWGPTEGNDPYPRDEVPEILLSAQYAFNQDYNGAEGRYQNQTTAIHIYNSAHTYFSQSWMGRTFDYGRPFATMGTTDWGYDMYTDRANDSRYYKTFLTDYVTTEVKNTSRQWDVLTAYVYNTYIKGGGDPSVSAGQDLFTQLGQRSIVYIENPKDKPLDSLWVASQPFVLNARWIVGSPGNRGYGSPDNLSAEVQAGLQNPVITDKGTRLLYYRVDGEIGGNYGLDYGITESGKYMSSRKYLDTRRGSGTDVNGGQSIDFPIFRLAETYLIRAEAYGRQGNYGSAVEDLNVLRRRAAYHPGETRNDMIIKYEPDVLVGALDVPAAEKVYPYTVTQDSYDKIRITTNMWTPGTPEYDRENYPEGSEFEPFIHFIYNERARELLFEFCIWEDLHNSGLLYERVIARDQLGAPSSSRGTTNFPFAQDDVASGTTGATGVGKGQFARQHTFKPWPKSFLDLLTDENGNTLDAAARAEYQNPGYEY